MRLFERRTRILVEFERRRLIMVAVRRSSAAPLLCCLHLLDRKAQRGGDQRRDQKSR